MATRLNAERRCQTRAPRSHVVKDHSPLKADPKSESDPRSGEGRGQDGGDGTIEIGGSRSSYHMGFVVLPKRWII
jgi:hypothetical protein